ncbi:MAG: hypothetical protein HC769_33055 [Cyanobacteria bacterium CRU_2_1]|nr:hypothetical protein [Cyanobacteria bacterium CRU_2_1]
MNRREIYWSTIPGSRSYANCEFVRRITGEPAEGQASGMASLGEAIDRLPTPLLQQEDRVDG